MLTFAEKVQIIEAFPQLTKKEVSLGRVNYQYEESGSDKKNVVYHLHPNGNGFVYAGNLSEYEADERGLVNIRDFSALELQKLIAASIHSLAPKTASEAVVSDEAEVEERWIGPEQSSLLLIYENELWCIYSGLNLEMAFETYEEAAEYLTEEGFRRQ